MVEILNREKITIEKPKHMRPEIVCFWWEEWGRLEGSQRSKAVKFVQNNCVRKLSEDIFVVEPIKGYNKTPHKVYLKAPSCSCQYNKKYGKICSHIIAVKMYNFVEKWNHENEPF